MKHDFTPRKSDGLRWTMEEALVNLGISRERWYRWRREGKLYLRGIRNAEGAYCFRANYLKNLLDLDLTREFSRPASDPNSPDAAGLVQR